MIRFLLRRFGQAIVVMLVVSIIAFAIQNNLGDPLQELVGQSVSEQERQKIREDLGINKPFIIQYGYFLKHALQGDLGISYFFKQPALTVILTKLSATLELIFVATTIIIVFSIPLGIYTAVNSKTWVTKCILSVSILGISVPVFLTAIALIYVFSVTLNWLPSYGRGDDLVPIFWGWETGLLTLDGWQHLILPSVSLASIMLPLFIRLVRSEMIEVMSTEYIKFAYAKGLNKKRVLYVHALKNTLLPVITVGGVQIGTMVAYTILTETIFQWPGMGFLFLEAITRVDTPLIVAFLIVVGGIFVVVNTLVDLIYGLVNPTVNLTRSVD